MEQKIHSFLTDNIKVVMTCVVFLVGFYMQHKSNTHEIERLSVEQEKINAKIEAQYIKLDNLKLDKSVYETQMKQIYEMSQDIREIRESIDNMMQLHISNYRK